MSKSCAHKSCVILAAGDGKRMKSDNPKVLMEVAFEPMLIWVIDAVIQAGINRIAVITGNNANMVESFLEDAKSKNPGIEIKTFLQTERKGTGHAVMQAESFLRESDGDVLVLCGDAPFVDSQTITNAYELHKDYAVTVITADIDEPTGYGRIIRNGESVAGIVEEKDCTDQQRKITEVNSGGYWFNTSRLLNALPRLTNQNKNGEYYLTDVVALLNSSSDKAGAYKTSNSNVTLGANDRRGLRELNKIATEMIINNHLDNGVDVIGEGSIIGRGVKIGKDTTILPNTIIKGNTVIGEGCTIGPNSLIENCKIGDKTTLNNVQAFDSLVEDNVKVGPFTQLRPNTTLRSGVKIGDFVEVKNSVIGENTSIAHLTYIGDSDVGRGVNFGCGCVTANYDGVNKHRTAIGDNAFIGCNTNLIAPVTIGENATTAAGSSISKDVPANSLAIERCPVVIKENWKMNGLRKKK